MFEAILCTSKHVLVVPGVFSPCALLHFQLYCPVPSPVPVPKLCFGRKQGSKSC